MPVRIAKLTRRSTDEKHQPYTIEAQNTKLDAYITSQDDWELAPGCDYTDDMSGATLERPGLTRALRDARLGRYDILLVYRVDRLARTIRGLAQVLEELDKAKVAFRSATEPFDTATPAGRMMVQMLGVFAEFERALIIDRVINGMTRKAASGQWTIGHRPYGYQIDPTTHVLVADVIEAPLVTVIFDLYVTHKQGTKAIAGWLNEHGHRTKAGKPWGHTAVLTVLRNRVYLGEIYFRETYYPAKHTPLVEPATFDAAQALLEERGEALSQRVVTATDYLLAGRVVCARCGKHYVGAASHNHQRRRYRYYVCFSAHRYGKTTCDAQRLPADELEAKLLERMHTTYQHASLFQRAIADSAGQAETVRDTLEQQLAGIPAKISKAEAAIERYYDAFEAGTLDPANTQHRLDKLGTQITQLRARQHELTYELEAMPSKPPSRAELTDRGERVRQALQTGPDTVRKSLVHALVEEIRVTSRDAIVPVFRVPGARIPDGAGDDAFPETERFDPRTGRCPR